MSNNYRWNTSPAVLTVLVFKPLIARIANNIDIL